MDLFQCATVTLLLFVVAVVGIAMLKGAIIVKEGNAAVIERDGKFRKVMGPGRHFIVPFVDTVRAEVNLSEQHFDTGTLNLSTAGMAPISFNMSVHYDIMRDRASPYLSPTKEALYRAVYTVHNWQEITKEEALAVVTQIVSGLDFKRDIVDEPGWPTMVGNRVRDELNKRANRWGVNIADVNITNIQYSESSKEMQSYEGKAKRESRKRVIEAEGVREVADTLGLSSDEMLRWRYIETLREAMSKPDARIMIAPEGMGGMSSNMLGQMQLNRLNQMSGQLPTLPEQISEQARLGGRGNGNTNANPTSISSGDTQAMPPPQITLTNPNEPPPTRRPPLRDVRTREEELGR